MVSDRGSLATGGEHQVEPQLEGRYLRRERRRLPFFRQIAPPAETRESEIGATFVNGILSVRIPRVEAPAPTRITIAVGSAAPALDQAPAPAPPEAATSPA